MTLKELIEEIEELHDESIMNREIMYFDKLKNGVEIYTPINAIGLSYTKILLAEQCPDCPTTKEIQNALDNIYKKE